LSGRHDPKRVFVGLTEISGYACNLCAGLRELGVQTELLDLQPAGFHYSDEQPPTRLMRLLQQVSRARLATSRKAAGRRRLLECAQVILLPLALGQALLRYDTFVFLYDTSFLRQRELPLLKLLRKRVVYVFCGSDVRPTYMSGGEVFDAEPDSIEECAKRTRAKKNVVRRVERWADVVISHPVFCQLQEQAFVKFLSIGIPREPGMTVPEVVSRPGPVTLLHAPSDPVAKGTSRIRDAVARVSALGHDVEFIELSGMPYQDLLAAIASCDVVLDQLYGDTPMAGLAADAALFGKPTIVGGYDWDDLASTVSEAENPPTHCCHPDEFVEAIVRLVEEPNYRSALGERAREFVVNRWSRQEVAERMLRVIRGDIPPEWFFDAREVRCVGGWGQSEEQSAKLIHGVVTRFGTEALRIQDKPELERRVLELGGLANTKEAAHPSTSR